MLDHFSGGSEGPDSFHIDVPIQAMDMEDTNIARQMFRVFDMDPWYLNIQRWRFRKSQGQPLFGWC